MIWYDMIWDWTGKNKKQQKTKANEWKAPDVIESWKQIKKKKKRISVLWKNCYGNGWMMIFICKSISI